jgi:hypothetical protein
VGIGYNTPTNKLWVKGTVRINDLTDIIFDMTGKCCGSPVIYPSTDWYLQLGKADRRIGTMYADQVFYNSLTKGSDIRIKENITPLNNPIEKLMQISAYNYNLKEEFYPEQLPEEVKANFTRKQIGFLAQELEKVFPELVIKPNTEEEFYSVNYVDMIPVLVEAIKEQQSTIENLQNKFQQEVETLKNALSACCTKDQIKSTEKSFQQFDLTEPTDANTETMKVYQNAPNPFNTTTTIQCYIPQNIQKAELCVYNMQGAQVKCLLVSERGTIDVQIQAGQLAAGVYTYLLIGDGKASDAKQMILTK